MTGPADPPADPPGDVSRPSPEEVEARLRALSLAQAQEGFRSRLRQRFLAAGAAGAAGSAAQTEGESRSRARYKHRSEGVSVDLEQALSRLPLPRARERYRLVLRQKFLREGAVLRPVVAPAHRAAGAPVAAGSRRGLRLLLGSGLVAAAAAVLLLVFLRPGRATAPWRILTPIVPGLVLADGMALADEPNLLAALGRPNAELSVGDHALELVFDELVQMTVRPGARLRFTGGEPGASSGLDVQLVHGEVFFSTFPAYHDVASERPLRVHTDQIDAAVRGTIFGVMASDEYTCLCVARGQVEVTSDGVRQEVDERHMQICFCDPEQEPLREAFPSDVDPSRPGHVEDLLRYAAKH